MGEREESRKGRETRWNSHYVTELLLPPGFTALECQIFQFSERSQKSRYLPYFIVSKIFFHTLTTLKLVCVFLDSMKLRMWKISVLKPQNTVQVKKNFLLSCVICYQMGSWTQKFFFTTPSLHYSVLQWFSISFLSTMKMLKHGHWAQWPSHYYGSFLKGFSKQKTKHLIILHFWIAYSVCQMLYIAYMQILGL